ncbi:PIG-L family deacetylase [Bacillus sp. FJAT-50079]|uniref:PIG-L family deacetylase n=1 Tax=Bacillus sp. FJAT-50079 TaxID=2833577 RepID=UPI001BC9B043|nr:PIG-L family deacetylase [Bacillus sp. FJAT-50079]MBS4208012.1 PIG-L family deacetylase [Bacillus sp. FJAT-50079]
MRKLRLVFLSFLLAISLVPIGFTAEKEKANVELWNVVKPLETTVTFVNTGAHPDDERSDFLAYLSRGLGVKTASLIANRGEGGQNEIGLELGNGLGIIRSREMVEAAKITNVKAYHLSEELSDAIYDFGFSKTTEETLGKWGEEVTYERLIRFIRMYQPDIVMPSFRDVDSQHGHHRTITVLSERAFQDAADPNVFPHQLKEGLSVWQTKKLYLPAESASTATTSIEIGMYDPIYEMSYPQLGEQSRYMHKSQGMGNDIPVAPRQVHLELSKSTVDTKGSNDLFAGIPYNFAEWADVFSKNQNDLKVHFTKIQKELDGIVAAYPNQKAVFSKSQSALKNIRNVTKKVEKSKLDRALKHDLLHKLSIKEEQLQAASFVAADLDIKVEADSPILTQGQKTKVSITLVNNGKEKLDKVEAQLIVPKGWKASKKSKAKQLKPRESAKLVYDVSVPKKADFYDAYEEPVIQVQLSYENSGSQVQHIEQLNETIAVLPDVGLTLHPEDMVVNTANIQEEMPVQVKVKNFFTGKHRAKVTLAVPEGWTVSPKEIAVDFSKQLEEKELNFTVSPPAHITEGNFTIGAEAIANGRTFQSTVQEIHYNHIGTFYYLYPSQINGAAFELLSDPDLKIGYIESGFDQVADYLTNAGLSITKLTEADLSSGDLNQYDSIVVGIRAYLSREDLAANNARLHEYVENGGHLVVQYHKPGDNWNANTTAPFPLTLGNPSIRWRVTDENAKVNVLQPESSLFNYPNQITDQDWEGWVQERGLYYPMAWDDRYETFVSMADPNEDPFDGGILMAQHGKGTYLYTNLVFYRQIQGQVPGGYRIFTNLISYKN